MPCLWCPFGKLILQPDAGIGIHYRCNMCKMRVKP